MKDLKGRIADFLNDGATEVEVIAVTNLDDEWEAVYATDDTVEDILETVRSVMSMPLENGKDPIGAYIFSWSTMDAIYIEK